jgi:hypothetical protein
MFFRRMLAVGFVAATVSWSGCQTPVAEKGDLSNDQLKQFFATARDPRRFWITVYQSENGPVFVGGNRLHPEQIAQLPFESANRSSAPIVLTSEGIPALIDTSSKESWMDFATAQRTGIIPLGPPAYTAKPEHTTEDAAGYLSVAANMVYDQLFVESALFYVRGARGPFGPLARKQSHPTPNLILGCSQLNAFRSVQLNYPARTVLLSTTRDYQPSETNLIASVPLVDVRGAYGAEGMIDGRAQTFIIDSAGDFAVAMANPPTNKLRQVSVGDLVFRQVDAVFDDAWGLGLTNYPRIGRQLLQEFKITFDSKLRVAHFERPD